MLEIVRDIAMPLFITGAFLGFFSAILGAIILTQAKAHKQAKESR